MAAGVRDAEHALLVHGVQHGPAACGDDHHTGQEGRQGVEVVSSLSESVCPWKWSVVCLDSVSPWTWSVPPESVSSWKWSISL